MTFRKLLIYGNLAGLLLIAITTVAAITALRIASAGTGELASEFAAELTLVQQLRVRSEEVVVASRGYLLTGEGRYRARFDNATSQLESDLATLRTRRLDGRNAVDTDAVEQAAIAYTVAAKRAGDERSTMGTASAIVPYFDATLQPLRDRLENAVETFVTHERARFDASLGEARAEARDAQIVLVAGAILANAIWIALAIFVSRKLSLQFEEVKAAQEVAKSAAAAREEVLAVVSHDLRNPLQAIVMGVALMNDTVHDERGRRHLHTVGNAAERMRHMLDELIEVARIDGHSLVLKRETCKAKQLVDETLELFQTRAVEHEIALRSEASDAPLLCDRERMLEILSNLVGNAFKFAPPGGEIIVKAEPTAHQIRFVVSDTGPGVEPDQVPHLFERFWQGRKARDGLGLGLYICKQLVEAHHGVIGVDSHLGEGTKVWFTVPRLQTAAL